MCRSRKLIIQILLAFECLKLNNGYLDEDNQNKEGRFCNTRRNLYPKWAEPPRVQLESYGGVYIFASILAKRNNLKTGNLDLLKFGRSNGSS